MAIIRYVDDDPDEGYKYVRNLKNGKYEFWFRKLSADSESKLDEIEEYYEDGWDKVRTEYIKLKNVNKDINKKSFVLYLESINNVYNQLMQSKENKQQSQKCHGYSSPSYISNPMGVRSIWDTVSVSNFEELYRIFM